jgi:hypothetical protein
MSQPGKLPVARADAATTTIYLSGTVHEQLDQAQAELERHLGVRPNGLCATCGESEPCAGRLAAGATFARYGRLPRRRPGGAGVRAASVRLGTNKPVTWFDVPTPARGEDDFTIVVS